MTNQPAQAALVRAAASFVRDTYSGEWADDAAATLETDADLIERGEPCSLLRLAETMQPAAVSAAVAPPTTHTDPELTAEEARTLADELGLQLYRAQDALAFVAECCDIADREQRTVTTADVREWLKGARCGRQLAADATGRGDCPDLDAIAARAADAQQYGIEDDGFEQLVREDVPALITALRRMPDETATETPAEVIHACPPDGSGLTPCCGRTPFELPRTDRISSEAPTTCTGPAAGARQDGEQQP